MLAISSLAEILRNTLNVQLDVDFDNALNVDGDTTLDKLTVDGLSDFNDSVFIGNVGDRGGALCVNLCTVDIHSSDFISNLAIYGGGVFINSGSVTIENSNFMLNSATEIGGGVYNNGAYANDVFVINSSQFTENMAKEI